MASSVVIAASLTAGERVSSAAAVEDEQWPNPHAATAGLHGSVLEDSIQAQGGEDSVSVMASGLPQNGQFLCTSIDRAPCAGASDYFYRALLQPCDASVTVDCIESFSATKSDGTAVIGKFAQMFPTKGLNEFEGSVSQKIPNGRSPSIWTLDGLSHSNGNKYAVVARVGGQKSDSISLPKFTGSFAVSIIPVSIFQTDCNVASNGTCQDIYTETINSSTGKSTLRFAGVAADNGRYRCVIWGEDSKCALRHGFPAGARFTVKIRLAKAPIGWFHGRVNQPEVSISENGGVSVLEVSASPVKTPVVAGYGQWSTLPQAVRSWFETNCPTGNNRCGTRVEETRNGAPTERNLFINPLPYKAEAFTAMDLWRDFVKDTATVMPSTWSIRTMSVSEMTLAPTCIQNGSGVLGIVSTNSTLYAEGPPALNSTTKTLEYKVSSPHYEPDGKTEFKGTYNLVVREDIADCLFKFDSEMASVDSTTEIVEEEIYDDEAAYELDDEDLVIADDEIVEEFSLDEFLAEQAALDPVEEPETNDDLTGADDVIDEKEVVATVSAEVLTALQTAAKATETITLENGWFRFSATDFTFSAPTVKARIGLLPVGNVACVSGASVKILRALAGGCPAGSSKAVTKFCAKGKAVKVVLGASTKCPKGYVAAKSTRCAKGLDVKVAVGVKPACAKGYKPLISVKCVSGASARIVTAVRPSCANGYTKALTITCSKGKTKLPVTAIRPTCPKGYKRSA